MDPVADLKGKEIKRATLNEIVDYITAGRGVLTEAVYPEIIRMVNIGRPDYYYSNIIFSVFSALFTHNLIIISRLRATSLERCLLVIIQISIQKKTTQRLKHLGHI